MAIVLNNQPYIVDAMNVFIIIFFAERRKKSYIIKKRPVWKTPDMTDMGRWSYTYIIRNIYVWGGVWCACVHGPVITYHTRVLFVWNNVIITFGEAYTYSILPLVRIAFAIHAKREHWNRLIIIIYLTREHKHTRIRNRDRKEHERNKKTKTK